MSDTPKVHTEKGRSVIEAVPVLHPYLLAIYPLLGLYAYNQQSTTIGAMIRPGIMLLAGTFILWLALGALFRNNYKAGFATSLIVVAATSGWNILEYGMASFMADLTGRAAPLYYGAFGLTVAAAAMAAAWYLRETRWDRLRLGVFIVVVAGAMLYLGDLILAPIFNRGPAWAILSYIVVVGAMLVIVYRWKGEMRRTTSTLNLFGGILLALSIANILINRPPAPADEPMPPVEAIATPTGPLPDVWLIALDGYARADVLASLYGLDTRPFIERLERRGFTYVAESTANYGATIEALVSCLNMLYLEDLAGGEGEAVYMRSLVHWYHDNRVGAFMRDNGYHIYTSAPPQEMLRPRGEVDRALEARLLPSEFEVVFLESTTVARLLQATHYIRHRSMAELRHIVQRAHVEGKLARVRALAAEPSDQPRFVQAHFPVPNVPFLFDANGDWPETVGMYTYGGRALFRGDMSEYRERYTGQVEWLNGQLLNLVDDILQNAARPPVILLVSMHGPAGPASGSQEQRELILAQRYLNFMALHVPGAHDIPSDLTPVNLFRVVLNHSMGLNEPLLPNQRFLSTGTDPILFEALP